MAAVWIQSITFTLDYINKYQCFCSLCCFFFLNLGAIMALETAAICVCACVFLMVFYKRDSNLQCLSEENPSLPLPHWHSISHPIGSIRWPHVMCVSESLGSLVHASTVKSSVCLCRWVFFFSSILVSFLVVSKGFGLLLNVPCCILLYFSCQ